MKAFGWAGLIVGVAASLLTAPKEAVSSRKEKSGAKIASQMIAALGGDQFLQLSAFRIAGHGLLPRQAPVRIDFTQKGVRVRSRLETSFWSSTEGFDGSLGWRRFGSEKPFKLSVSPLELLAKNGLSRIQVIEADSTVLEHDTLLDKTSCWWLKAFDSLSGEIWIFVDQKSARPKELFSPSAGIAAALYDYRPVQGIWFPYKVNVRRGNQVFLELTIDSVLVNPPVSDSFFALPPE